MSEKTASQLKNRLIVFALCFVLIILKGLHGAGQRGMIQLDVFAALIAGAFAYSFLISMNVPADGRLLSVQNILGAISACGLIVGTFDYREISVEVFAMLAVFAGGLLFVKEIRYLPAAAALAILSHCFFQYTAITAIPVLFAAGFTLNWHKVKAAPVFDKIIFGISEAVLLGASVYCFVIFKDSFNIGSIAAYWLNFVAVAAMSVLALYVAFRAFKENGRKIEALGYVSMAAAALPITLMSSRNANMIVAATALALIVISNGDTAAKKTFDELYALAAKKLGK